MAVRRRKTSGSRKSGAKRAKRHRNAALGSASVIKSLGKRTLIKSMKRDDEVAGVMVRKAGKALRKPGISKLRVVFRNQKSGIFSYSIDPNDLTRIIRESPDGTRRTGRLVRGKFKA